MSERRSLTAWLPSYSVAQSFLRIVDGMSVSKLKAMRDDVLDQRGTPQSTANWSDPGKWIRERLHGDSETIAWKLWEESKQSINPRYCNGLLSLLETHRLADYLDDKITLTDAGTKFLANDDVQLAQMDEYDGMLLILSEVAEKSPGKRRDFERRYAEFCRTFTTYSADSSISSSLIARLNNLVDRNLIDRNGHTYQITDLGISYLATQIPVVGHAQLSMRKHQQLALPTETSTRAELRELAKRNNDEERNKLTQYLKSMDPHGFERLIKPLLEDMGYEEVGVNAQSHDKGVDVVGEIELGISRVREVIQVKRQQSNVGRPILDALRGSLHRFDAVRATIITTGGFTKSAKDAAFEKGAAPITLIDGERLLELLIEYEIGIRRKEIRILEFDRDSLVELETEAEGSLQSSELLSESE
ncbi:MAG: restriction endonuclease [Chloroflexota bacterium]|nr:restriction endonuclease [Chloroflexota bacterium]